MIPTQEMTTALHTLLVEFPSDPDGSWAATAGMIDRLAKQGADLSAVDADGLRPLERVLSWDYNNLPPQARCQAHSVVSALLKNGAPLENRPGMNLSSFAQCWNDDQRAAKMLVREELRRHSPLLRQKVAEISIYWPCPGEPVTPELKRSFIRGCVAGDMEKTIYFIHAFPRCRAWADDEDFGFQVTALMATAIKATSQESDPVAFAKATSLLLLLAKDGGDVNWKNDKGNTALHYACSEEYRCPRVVHTLVDLGADPDLINNDGWSARHMATRASRYGDDQSSQMCLEVLNAAQSQQRKRAAAETPVQPTEGRGTIIQFPLERRLRKRGPR